MMLQISFHNLSHSPAIAAKVRQRVEKLERICEDISSCRVAIEAPHRHKTTGNAFAVHIEVAVPGEKLVSNRQQDEQHADLYVAIRDAFDAMRRQLKEYAGRRRDLRESARGASF